MGTLSWVAIATLELIVVLAVALGLAVALCRRQRRMLAALQTALVERGAGSDSAVPEHVTPMSATPAPAAAPVVAGAAEPAPPQAEPAPTEARSYADHIEEQILVTRDRHLALTPDRDIVLDIAPEAPLERQALALRHAFLIAEKEAALGGDGDRIAWDVLMAKLSQIILYYRQTEPASGAPDPRDLDEELDANASPAASDAFSDGLDDFPLESLDIDGDPWQDPPRQ